MRRVGVAGVIGALMGAVAMSGALSDAASATVGAAVVLALPAAPSVEAGCLGVDRSPGGDQIRIALRTDGADGAYRASFVGPTGAVQGDGRVGSGLGLVLVPVDQPGSYSDLVITDVARGQAVTLGPLAAMLPVVVGAASVPCDATSLTAPTSSTATSTSTVPPASGDATATTNAPAPAGREVGAVRITHTTDAPPWILLAVPGAALLVAGIVLLVRARPGHHSRRTT